MSEPIYINSSSFHVEILDQDLVDISNIYITSIEEIIQMATPFHHDGEVTITNPPVRMYRSLEEVETALHEFSRDQGFEITRGGAKRSIGKSTGFRPSNCPGRCSKLTDCSWAIMIYTDNIQDPNGSEAQWSFRFGKPTEHNNGGVHASGLANHRRDRAQNLILTRDLHNEAARFRHEKCNLRTPVEVAMSILDDNFFWDYEINNENSAITMLFFAHYSMIRILRDNPQIIILDATYGTQKYGLPLFKIIVITRIGITIPVA
ncbi:hypothetical protein GcM3_217040 [Golovinomyces cichoracearum]|uniref:ZSWIM1/3 RNaseH-like domain-containing protein n=1 Tax=Golovinomyces cichoracearum TaxID=62708 RepID=A0A420H7Y1_9PEZI|nr:hypothetical protein GcM3_217040 [Golovinomyces cichoracearum]